jgi:methylenetetrahydrofolate reductase (NADPH)
MRIGDVYRTRKFGLSIEVFPPKSEAGDAALNETLQRAAKWQPAFISCTYGAGGSTQSRTFEICSAIQEQQHLTATAHFTCVGATRDQLISHLTAAQARGIHNIMALRGDPPQGETNFTAVAGGLKHANELVALIREHFPNFGIGVAGYPEKHPEAADMTSDLMHLQQKVAAGADAVFTQLFYENSHFYRFRDRCEQLGITCPIVPGIMPITEFARIKRITSLCKSEFPSTLAARLEAVQNDAAAQFAIGVEFAIQQCQELIDRGVPGIHFYVLNRMDACDQILNGLRLPSGG